MHIAVESLLKKENFQIFQRKIDSSVVLRPCVQGIQMHLYVGEKGYWTVASSCLGGRYWN